MPRLVLLVLVVAVCVCIGPLMVWAGSGRRAALQALKAYALFFGIPLAIGGVTAATLLLL